MRVKCCVCKKVRHGHNWLDEASVPAAPRQRISHGYCPTCAAKAFAELTAALGLSHSIPPRAISVS